MIAEVNRDPKRRSKPFRIADFLSEEDRQKADLQEIEDWQARMQQLADYEV